MVCYLAPSAMPFLPSDRPYAALGLIRRHALTPVGPFPHPSANPSTMCFFPTITTLYLVLTALQLILSCHIPALVTPTDFTYM